VLWIDMCVTAPDERSRARFAEHCEVRTVVGGELALAGDLVELARPDAICFDYDYPDMTALRQVLETKKRHPAIPVLMATVQNSADLVVWALRARVFDCLIKPLAAGDVEQCITRLGHVREARQQQAGRRALAVAPRTPVETRYRPRSEARSRVQKVIPHLQRNLGSRIAVTEIAALCGMSSFTFSREFRAAFGVTFQQYLGELRVKEAQRLLANQAMPIVDVGAAVGLDDPSYFSRMFRRAVGLSPSEYRSSLNARPSPDERMSDDTATLPLPFGLRS
jgi:AraC-like DNA-binding protein